MSVESLDAWRKKLESTSNSPSQSMQNMVLEGTGPTHISDEEADALRSIYALLGIARIRPFTTKSTMARDAANEIGMCASEGLLTTKINETTYGNVWLVTQDGLDYMEELEDVFSSD